MPLQNSTQTYVLAIGLNEYPRLGPAATLKGALHDATAWARFAREGLLVGADQLQVLSSPRLSPDTLGLPGEQVHGATLAEVEAALDAMVSWLTAHEDGSSTALIVFSGHGAHLAAAEGAGPDTDFAGDRLALVLEDGEVEGGLLRGALVLNQLGARLGAEGLQRRVTVVVDACYDTVRAEAFDRSTLGQELPQQAEVRMRLLLGAALGSRAYEGVFGGEWRGVYSFALLTLLGQWERRRVSDVMVVLGSYSELTYRARALLGALGYSDQAPSLAGNSRAANLPFNNPSVFNVPVPATWTPDGFRRPKELSGDSGTLGVYSFTLKSGQSSLVVAQCLWLSSAVSYSTLSVDCTSAAYTLSKGREIWWFGSVARPSWYDSATLTITWTPLTAVSGAGGAMSVSFSPDTSVAWKATNITDLASWVTGVPGGQHWYKAGELWLGLAWTGNALDNVRFLEVATLSQPPSLKITGGRVLSYDAGAPPATKTLSSVHVKAV